eukprot:2079302-Rhodomonas_salina.1
MALPTPVLTSGLDDVPPYRCSVLARTSNTNGCTVRVCTPVLITGVVVKQAVDQRRRLCSARLGRPL